MIKGQIQTLKFPMINLNNQQKIKNRGHKET